MRNLPRLLCALYLLMLVTGIRPADGASEPLEGSPTVVSVAPFLAGDAKAAVGDTHAIAQEFFMTHLAATQKFSFAADPKNPKVELRVSGWLRREGDAWGRNGPCRCGGKSLSN